MHNMGVIHPSGLRPDIGAGPAEAAGSSPDVSVPPRSNMEEYGWRDGWPLCYVMVYRYMSVQLSLFNLEFPSFRDAPGYPKWQPVEYGRTGLG